ncbi:unnamed protein product [Rotaria sp. Silwood2]|nr:unnamed protein product [Rotaria sp. Silwood2]
MINFPTITDSVYVSMAQTGYLKTEFNSTYPIHLNAISFGGNTTIGITLFIVGGIKSGESHDNGFPVLVALVIDIGRSMASERILYQSNPISFNPVSIYEYQDYYAPPLYYSTLPQFCSNYNAPKRDSLATFCTTCGVLFSVH